MQAPSIPHVEFATLPSHPDCPIAYTFKQLQQPVNTRAISSPTSGAQNSQTAIPKPIVWLIFVNGLGLPQAFWQPTIQLLESDIATPSIHGSALHQDEIYVTTFDRYGQGLSRPSLTSPPSDDSTVWTPKPHSCLDAATELAELMSFLCPRVLSSSQASSSSGDKRDVQVVLIGHSLGVPIVRLFMASQAHHTNTNKVTHTSSSTTDSISANVDVVGLIFLDSNIASLDMTDLLPDPHDPNCKLLSDTTMEQLRTTRENYSKMFAPSAPNAENIDRVSLLTLLSKADAPLLSPLSLSSRSDWDENQEKLKGGIKRRLALTVVAHDPDAFAEEGLRISTRGLTEKYIEPAWRKYNSGLVKLDGSGSQGTEEDAIQSGEKIVVAKGAGHFIQRDNPRCVADEIWKILERITS